MSIFCNAMPLRAGDGVAELHFHKRHIGAADAATDIYVVAEVRRIERLSQMRLGLAYIGGVDRSVAGGIADEHRHRRRYVAHVHAIAGTHERDGEALDVGYSGKI